MDTSRQVEFFFYRRIGRQRGRVFSALAQVIGRTAIPFLRKYIMLLAKRVGADLFGFAASEIAEVVNGRKNFTIAAKSGRRQILRKQCGSGNKMWKAAKSGKELADRRQASRVISTKSTELSSWWRIESFASSFH